MRSIRSILALVAVLAFAAGCGAGAPSASLPAATAASGDATPKPTPTAPPAVTKRFAFEPAAMVTPAAVDKNELYVNPGAVFEAGGALQMFANVFSQWPGRVRVPHLTSADGITWTPDGGVVLDSKNVSIADPGIDVSTGYVADDGTWVLYLETVSTIAPWEVWRATAQAPGGPWTVGGAAVLAPGAAGSFDSGGITWPQVIRIGDQWAMYYAGTKGPGQGTGSIGVAFSDDGVTWTKHPDPVLTASEKWEGGSLDRPRVAPVPGGYVMVYAGRDLTKRGLATSTDGLTWTKVPGPSIERKDFPEQGGGSWDCALLYRDGQLVYFLEIGQSTTKVYRATLAWP